MVGSTAVTVIAASERRNAEIFEEAKHKGQQGDSGDDVRDIEVALGDNGLFVPVDLGHALSPGHEVPSECGLGPAPFEGDNGRARQAKTVDDRKLSKTGHATITVRQDTEVCFKTQATNVEKG